MYGHRPLFHPGGANSRRGQGQGRDLRYHHYPPPQQHPSQNIDANLAFQNPNFYQQTLANALFQGLAAQQQNLYNYVPSFPIQNPNFPIQNLNIPPPLQFPNFLPQEQQQQLRNSGQLGQNPSFPVEKPDTNPSNHDVVQQQPRDSPSQNVKEQQQLPQSSAQEGEEEVERIELAVEEEGKAQQCDLAEQKLQPPPVRNSCSLQQHDQRFPRRHFKNAKRRELMERVDRAVEEAWSDLIAAGESVSAWKVSQAALVILRVDSWGSLGFPMQEVPSLYRLILVEGKINAFIHCFVGVRRITSLYDLEVAICENEGIVEFEELELGPLVRHPLVLHYFSVTSNATEILKITTEDVIMSLHEYMSTFRLREINIDEFLDFIAKKRSVKGKGNLGVRIQGLGMHISFIREAKRSKSATLKKCLKMLNRNSGGKSGEATLKKCQKASEEGSGNKCEKHPLVSSQKKDLDERFSSISQRIESFALVHKDFRGKHIRFYSSDSENEESDDGMNEIKISSNSDERSNFSLQNVNNTDKVSSCPYPSATEEMSRLGLKGEMGGQSTPVDSSSSLRTCRRDRSRGKKDRNKRKLRNVSCTASAPSKLLKGETGKHNIHQIENGSEAKNVTTISECDISLSNNSMKIFIATWKNACEEHSVAEVLERMLQFYVPGHDRDAARSRKQMKLFSSLYPYIGLLNVAVASIKCGMLDSIYDTFQAVTQCELPTTHSEYESIVVEQGEKHTLVPDCSLQKTHGVTVEEVIEKITRYYELDSKFENKHKSVVEDKFISLKKLSHCKIWLVNQFGIKQFKSLGHGKFFNFLEKHFSVLPTELQKLVDGDICEKSKLEVSLHQQQLIVLVSQASNNLLEGETLSKQMISALLAKQFPLLSLQLLENGSIKDFLHIVDEYKNDIISKCVLFSATLLGNYLMEDPVKEDHMAETSAVRTSNCQKVTPFEFVTSNNAIEILLKAPMLSDLSSWSHWDLIFAPSLGSLVEWLLSKVNPQELLCLVTKDGKVIRIDQSANADSFLEAALQRSSFQTAVKLLSLLALAGGERHVPLSLLKCYARHAFDIILKNDFENMEVQDNKNYVSLGKVVDEVANNLSVESPENLMQRNQVFAASRFVLDCLGYLPSEFRGFASDVMLSGMQSVIKDAPSAMLCQCNQTERLMLHEIGLSIGIVEWINDYNTFCSAGTADLFTSYESACFEITGSVVSTGSRHMQNSLNNYFFGDVCHGKDAHNGESTETSLTIQDAVVSSNGIVNSCAEELSDPDKLKDAALVIESIRRDEFGLDQSLSCTESSMLRKQHARLGRALHCLSQELYSEDSHFLLELVQNADDNIYPESVEPTLTFILQESGIVVLNNERGFSAQNIRALCDVGNSTKKGSGTGYIGQKGIGFKSVFRLTDAPEIHSNGFHVKFDISEGQIGFVLPTIIPPCDIELFSRLVSRESYEVHKKCWNTCIVLPFRSKLSEETAMKMFSDLHPSLLLFLHRLQCIIFRNMLSDTLLVMRKEILQDGIVKVSCGKDKMTWLVASQKLQAHASRPKVKSTEIAIAFTLEESDNGDYHPRLDQQPVFAFLPLRTYGLKFILQGDFVLPSSREEVDRNNPWNEWLLTKFPGLFVNAEKLFCALSCFRENPGKAVAAYMRFVPLVGEVHGFFSGLPKAIALKLRLTSCLLLEGDNFKMVPPCSTLRGWNEEARHLLPSALLQEHLGLGFLDKDIVLSDSLARTLGVAEYGPEILIKFITCLSRKESGLKSMGLSWLSSFLSALYTMLSHSSAPTDFIDSLRQIPFIPLSDGTYSSVNLGTIWLHSDILRSGFDGALELEAFPQLYAKLRTVNSALFSVSAFDGTLVDNSARMLQKIGVQQLSAHEIVKVHVLPAICDDRMIIRDKGLMTDYISFVMIHLQSSCPHCCVERNYIISELQNKAYILTNFGYRRLVETSIHFSKEFGNPININKLINIMDVTWHEVDATYLKHPVNDSLSNGMMKWRGFFKEIGVTDFVQVVQIEKGASDLYHTGLKNVTWDMQLISPGSLAKDWESFELVQILSLLSATGDKERCKYLLQVLDTTWEDSFSDKATGYCYSKSSADGRTFKSSFLSSIHDVQWVVSSMDDKLHFPTDLFHDCDAVRSILGACAPYACPKVSSTKLLSDIGFKTKVTLNDALEILRVWRESETPFKASIGQMSKLYAFIWDEMSASNIQISKVFHSFQFIFVPYESCLRHEDLVPGAFLYSEEVYWHDPTGCVDRIKDAHPWRSSTGVPQRPFSKTLCNLYAGLREFFVKECGVHEYPSCRGYLDLLQQLSTVALPSETASTVLQVFLKWAEGLKSGLLSSEDVIHIKECLLKVEYTVLPTVQDKWVSLHPSFGIVCWCDDKNLKIFKDLDNINFLYFGSHTDYEDEMLQTKVSDIVHLLGIPAISEIITREAIYYGLADSSFHASLINWALPYAQRYIYGGHPDKYFQLKQSGFVNPKHLKITVVEKLFYRNAIKSSGSASKKRYECSCLLQGNTLYTTSNSDSHALFLELSRLFFDGSSDLHLANFLHMIKTMVESGSTGDQIEFFIVNSQKVSKLPDDESAWSLSSISSLTEEDENLKIGAASTAINQQKTSKSNRKLGISSNWPPVDWKSAPGFSYAHENGFKREAVVSHPCSSGKSKEDDSKGFVSETDSMAFEMDAYWTIEENTAGSILAEFEDMDNHFVHASNQTLNIDIASDPVDLPLVSDCPESSSSKFCQRERLNTGRSNASQLLLTGRLGEHVAFKYLTEKFGEKVVKWVNEENETGLPYDIVIGEEENSREYFEVKATKSARKDWFIISMREWQFAVEKGGSFSIVHVVLSGNNTARVTVLQNPVKQCQAGKLQLVVMLPRQQKESTAVS